MAAYAWGVPYDDQRAHTAVVRAAAGNGTPDDAKILLDLFRKATRKRGTVDEAERVANECAKTFADYLDGLPIVLADLPEDVRRRISAYRHLSNGLGRVGITARDQFGRLPSVPAIERPDRPPVEIIDVEPVE